VSAAGRRDNFRRVACFLRRPRTRNRWAPCCNRTFDWPRCYDWELTRHLTYSPHLVPGRFSLFGRLRCVTRTRTRSHTHGKESVGNLGLIVDGKIEVPCS